MYMYAYVCESVKCIYTGYLHNLLYILILTDILVHTVCLVILSFLSVEDNSVVIISFN